MPDPRERFGSVDPQRHIGEHISKKRSDRDVVTGTTKVQGHGYGGPAPTSQQGTLSCKSEDYKEAQTLEWDDAYSKL